LESWTDKNKWNDGRLEYWNFHYFVISLPQFNRIVNGMVEYWNIGVPIILYGYSKEIPTF
jgi:hypothetical protein